MTHIWDGKLSISESDNGLWPGRSQAIICNNATILWLGPFNDNLLEIHTFSVKEMYLKMSSVKWHHFADNVFRKYFTQVNSFPLQPIIPNFIIIKCQCPVIFSCDKPYTSILCFLNDMLSKWSLFSLFMDSHLIVTNLHDKKYNNCSTLFCILLRKMSHLHSC